MIATRRSLIQRSLIAAPVLTTGLGSLFAAPPQPPAAPDQWYWYPFHSLAMKATGRQTGGTCTWMLVENSPKQGVPFHKHLHEDESFYVVDGLFEITVGDTTVTGGPGTYIFGPRNVHHRWTNMGSARGRLLNVFTPAGIEDYFLTIGVPIHNSDEQPKVDTAPFEARGAQLREKYGIIRTGPLKFPPDESSKA